MEFVRSIAGRVTVLHEGRVLAEGDMDTCRTIRRCDEVYLGVMSLLTVTALNQSYGGSHTLWDVDLTVPAGIAHVPHGPQRHGQDHAAQMHHGPAARRSPAR